jgi:2-phospho-L-lactate guanylyltransferase (CobY/MobA/RfbA family)
VRSVAFLVPLKPFSIAKERLRDAGVSHVDSLARNLAMGVLDEIRSRPLFVVSDSLESTAFARSVGIEVIESPVVGLNESVSYAYRTLGREVTTAIIVHGDLAAPEGLGTWKPGAGVTVITDRRGFGTNVLALPTGLEWNFAYGPESAERHVREAQRLALTVTTVRNSPWGWDIDEPNDLEMD